MTEVGDVPWLIPFKKRIFLTKNLLKGKDSNTNKLGHKCEQSDQFVQLRLVHCEVERQKIGREIVPDVRAAQMVEKGGMEEGLTVE